MLDTDQVIRVRLAPSPTGQFHIGTARTALFNYLFAKKYGGAFILRIEDTDKERSKPEYTKDIMDSLLWLGIGWDEGPQVGGAAQPYFQSERVDLYKKHLDQLLEQKKAYKCFCTPAETDKERESQQAKGQAPRYSGKCRKLTEAEIKKNEAAKKPYAIRLKVEPQKVEFDDLIRGHLEFQAELFGDFPLYRSDGLPLFIFSNAIDDNAMEITHVLRGEEHLSNTAKQIVLCNALNFLPPQFGHFPLILNPDRSKMSKRKNPVSIADDYRVKGFLPEALINYLVLLGWSSGTDREIYTIHELIEEFQIERVGKSPSIFDQEKLLWMNGYYIRHAPLGQIASLAQGFITDPEIHEASHKNPDFYLQVVSLVQDRLKTLAEIEPLITFFYRPPADYSKDLLVAKKSDWQRTAQALQLSLAALRQLKSFTLDELEIALRQQARQHDLKDGELLWAVRVALTGKEASPGVFEVLEVLGQEESVRRLATALEKLET